VNEITKILQSDKENNTREFSKQNQLKSLNAEIYNSAIPLWQEQFITIPKRNKAVCYFDNSLSFIEDRRAYSLVTSIQEDMINPVNHLEKVLRENKNSIQFDPTYKNYSNLNNGVVYRKESQVKTVHP